MEVGIHDDGVLFGPEAGTWLERASEIGATRVRSVVYGPEHLESDDIDTLISRAEARGLKVQLVLHWNSWRIKRDFTSAKYLAFVRRSIRRFSSVDRFSILNEPDLSLPEQEVSCGWHVRQAGRYERFRRYRFKRVRSRLYRRSPGKVGRRLERQRIGTKRAKAWSRRGRLWVKRRRSVAIYSVRLHPERLKDCVRPTKGAFYRALFRKAYTAIKQERPDAQVLFGETSPITARFTQQALCLIPTTGDCSRIAADGFAHHPYQFVTPPEHCATHWDSGGIGCMEDFQQMLKGARIRTRAGGPVPLYLTEFGYLAQPRSGLEPLDPELAAAWSVRAQREAARVGAREFVWYQLAPSAALDVFAGEERWDTSLWSEHGPRKAWDALRP